MPSFDIVSEITMHEVQNAVDNANREIRNRFDFRGVEASFTLVEKDKVLKLSAEADLQIRQMNDIIREKLAKRNIDAGAVTYGNIEQSGKNWNEEIKLISGIEQDLGKKIVKLIKDSKIKVSAQIKDESVRVVGKKRDDLQSVISLVKTEELGRPFQFINFRD